MEALRLPRRTNCDTLPRLAAPHPLHKQKSAMWHTQIDQMIQHKQISLQFMISYDEAADQ
jgi:hypothetical protein